MRVYLLGASALALLSAGAAHAVSFETLPAQSAFEGLTAKPAPADKGPRVALSDQANSSLDSVGRSDPMPFAPPPININTVLVSGFEGTSDYNSRALGAGLVPPDTMGAVGTTQYVQLINGTFSVYNKATGALATPRVRDNTFWQAAGGTSTGGDPRILFDTTTSRWLAVGFSTVGSTPNPSSATPYTQITGLQVAVSATADALGVWKSASFTAYNGAGFGGAIADYPTLSISGDAILIGTNNFAPATAGGAQGFRGTTLNVLNRSDVFTAAGPVLTSLKQFVTPFNGATPDNGYAIQGVNSAAPNSTAHVIASSRDFYANVFYDVNNAGTAGATQTASAIQAGGSFAFTDPLAVRQPVVGANARVMTAGDTRTGSNAWEVNGRTYFATTVKVNGTDHDVVRITVMNSTTGLVLSQTDIGGGASDKFDYSYGSVGVNADGQVVVGYNRSGDITTGIAGRISIFARSFNTNANGTLQATSGEVLIKQSLVDEYHTGSAVGQAASGRQRFGDYSTVTVDPTDQQRFWVIGEFAREYNTIANHPEGSGSGFGRWGTYIGQLQIGVVPEPATWAMMIGGFGFVGAAARRRRAGFASA